MSPHEFRNPWLVAVWPGMGGVGQIAVEYLIRGLGAQPFDGVAERRIVERRSVPIRAGLIRRGTRSIGQLFAWRDPAGRRDLLVFVGERQPEANGQAWCEDLLDRAQKLGVSRVFTFAAMGADVAPEATPRVRIAATGEPLLASLRELGGLAVDDGEIAGLNGLLVAAAADRGLDAACLLGEMPFYAAGLPNPRASSAVLRLFANFAELPIDLVPIESQCGKVDVRIVRQLEALRRAAQALAEETAEGNDDDAFAADGQVFAVEAPEVELPDVEALPSEVVDGIEELFAAVAQDRSRAVELKNLLDRHQVFHRYEDRFLDLFRGGR